MTPSELLCELRSFGPIPAYDLFYWISDHAHLFRRSNGQPLTDSISFGLYWREVGMLAERQGGCWELVEVEHVIANQPKLSLPPPQKRWTGEDA